MIQNISKMYIRENDDTYEHLVPVERYRLFLFAIVLISAIPILNVIWIIASTGANNLSNDSRAFVVPIDQMLSGTYNWSGFFRDSTYGAHFLPVLLLFHLMSARLFHWNVYAEMFVVVGICLLRVYFWFQAFRSQENSRTSWFLLPIICALVFSDSQIALFINPDAGIPIGLTLLALALGVWALAKLKMAPIVSLLLMCLAGFLASFSWGNGISIWLTFLLTMILFSYRKWWHYMIWAVGTGISLIPYAYNLAYARLVQSDVAYPGTTFIGFFKWKFILESLGRPFCNDIGYNIVRMPHAFSIGWVVVILCSVGLCLHFFSRSQALRSHTRVPLIFIAYSLVSLWQISTARVFHAPWYTALAIPLWIGLIALTFNVALNRELGKKAFRALSLAWAGVTVIFATVLYFSSNRTYEDKSTYLMARSPASASALRNYLSGPTYSENYLFQWGLGNFDYVSDLARPLERHSLSVFAPHQKWTLQGDWLLDKVVASHPRSGASVFWSTNKSREGRLPWYHYKHLNLCLLGTNTVEWTLRIPDTTNEAILHSAISAQYPTQSDDRWLSKKQEKSRQSLSKDSVRVVISLREKQNTIIPVYDHVVLGDDREWHDVALPLTKYKGQSITLSFAGNSKHFGLVTAFRYPYIDLKLTPRQNWIRHPVAPSNTDLSPDITRHTGKDMILGAVNNANWSVQGLDLSDKLSPCSWKLKKRVISTLSYLPKLNVPISAYSHFAISLSASKDITPRAMTVYMAVNNRKEKVLFILPLLYDGKMHEYTYNLRLLELEPDTFLTGLTFAPVINGTGSDPAQIAISDIRLIHR